MNIDLAHCPSPVVTRPVGFVVAGSNSMVERLVPSPEAMDELARRAARLSRPGDVVALSGELGAGKTRFARAFIQARLGRVEDVPSPTFTLAQRYGSGTDVTWHFDLYRLEDPSEVAELGVDDAIAEGVVLIEWPERLDQPLSPDRLEIGISFASDPDSRRVSLVGRGRWEALVPELARL
jgi:tRNA threonylcarbamoyladenosine biosynthesis protein TsaE